VGDAVVSNVNLLSRFLYAFKDVRLGSRRPFRIHAGFIFEEMVARELTRFGFDVTDIKRINRKEFDVVATSDGVIYNFQCKNNAIDLSNAESDRELFVRYNRRLVRYYLRAIAKEERREHLLKSKLGLDAVRHFVIQQVSGRHDRGPHRLLQQDRHACLAGRWPGSAAARKPVTAQWGVIQSIRPVLM
jgi:hypothetical protein